MPSPVLSLGREVGLLETCRPRSFAIAPKSPAITSESSERRKHECYSLASAQTRLWRGRFCRWLALQSLRNFAHQCIARERLLQEVAFFEEFLITSVVFQVARHINNPQALPKSF